MSEGTRPVSRDNTSRETADKPKTWLPPKRLPTFEDVNPDYHYRWVRYEVRGESDHANVLSRVREGYEPVEPEEVGLYNHPTLEDGRFAGTVISGDLMLMKISKDMAEQRTKYYASLTTGLQRTVDQELKESDDELTPISKSVKSGTTTGKPHFRDETD